MNTIHVNNVSTINTNVGEKIKLAEAARKGNNNFLKERLNEQQIKAVQEVLKRFN